MTYRGHIQNGQIILDEPADLPEGTRVSVEPLAQSSATQSGSAAAILSALEPWDGPAEELDRLMAEIQQMRNQDMLPNRDDLG
jgi:hypothetical protein